MMQYTNLLNGQAVVNIV